MQSIPLAAYDDFEHQDMVKYLGNLASEYAELHWEKYADDIVEFPIEEGHAPTAKKDMIFTVTRQFLEWCATRDNHQPPSTFP